MMLSCASGQPWANRQLHGQPEVCVPSAHITLACDCLFLLLRTSVDYCRTWRSLVRILHELKRTEQLLRTVPGVPFSAYRRILPHVTKPLFLVMDARRTRSKA